ncbi:hypothetical protein BG60_18220 [Caballeronia zhejiangensis]|uniref:DUF4007 domain-containing protein n=2 Tax=Caballeronia zhejiangensis TaxID=871203 RepID=A0A656QC51_9BURK|nr:hypothetical protein BG60_18220 [Caballeronia zhejiangensis]
MENLIESAAYSPAFSGHETFPLRQMWLKKAFDQRTRENTVDRNVFLSDEAIARFGVGKNMVSAIRHWALACRVLEDYRDTRIPYVVTPYGDAIFSDSGLDPFSEHLATAWFVHWCLAGEGNRATTWFWMFNRVSSPAFTRDDVHAPLMQFALKRGQKLSASTLSRDIETCIRSYVPRAGGGSPEDYAEPLLGELGLLQEEQKGTFAFRRGPKITLPDGMFAFALSNYWRRTASAESSLAFEAIAYGDGSPGRVFKLDEDSVADRLFGLAALTNGRLVWDDTAGLRQVIRRDEDLSAVELDMLRAAYV